MTLKMLKRILGILLLIVCAFWLPGCTGERSSPELQEEVMARCTPLAESWFADHMADAGDISVVPSFSGPLQISTDIVEGFYSRNGEAYAYFLNVDTGEFYSEEYYLLLRDRLEGALTEALRMEFVDLYFPMEEPVIHGTATKGKAAYEISKGCTYCHEMLDEDGLKQCVQETLSRFSLEFTLIVENQAAVLENISQLSCLKEHQNWIITVKEDRDDALELRISYENGEYHIAEEIADKKAHMQYKLYTLEDPGL